MKLAFVNKLIEQAEADPRVMLLTGDLGYQIFDEFAERFGPRFINVGVAEAQMTLAAAGLAFEGFKPVTYSIASFTTARCFEQIKLSVAYPNLPVVIVGAGGGYAYSHSGVTHHAGEDMAILSSLPGMTVVAPGDANEIEQLLPQVMELPGPSYFRIGRGREPTYKRAEPAILGKARLLQDGRDIALISTGEIAGELISALEILKQRGIEPIAYQFHTVKPLDTNTLDALFVKVDKVVVIEEHVSYGGLGSQVGAWFSCKTEAPTLVSLCINDEFVFGSPGKDEMRADYGLDANGIVRAVESLLR